MKRTALVIGQGARPYGDALAGALDLGAEEARLDDLLSREKEPDVALTVASPQALPDADAALSLALQVSKPLVLLPPSTQRVGPVCRVLVPLDGSAEAVATVSHVRQMFLHSGAELLILHVFERATVPAFWDQPTHARTSWARQLLLEVGDGPETRVETRSGDPVEAIDEVARTESVDLVALGWRQDGSPERCQVVRRLLRRMTTPVMLIAHPTGAAP